MCRFHNSQCRTTWKCIWKWGSDVPPADCDIFEKKCNIILALGEIIHAAQRETQKNVSVALLENVSVALCDANQTMREALHRHSQVLPTMCSTAKKENWSKKWSW